MNAFIDTIINSDDSQSKLSKDALSNQKKMESALDLMLNFGGLYERLLANCNRLSWNM